MPLIDDSDDLKKFEDIYETYNRLMFKIAFDILHNEFEAENAVQNTLIKVAREIYRIDDVHSKETRNLVALMTKQMAINLLNKISKFNTVPLDEAEPEIDENMDLNEIVYTKQLKEKIYDSINELSSPYCEAASLRFVNEMSIAEISEILQRKSDVVRKQISRARISLREKLRKEGFDV